MYNYEGEEQKVGFYSLEMAGDLEIEPKPQHVIAFEDPGDSKNFCYIMQSHLEMLGKGKAFIVPQPPKVRTMFLITSSLEKSLVGWKNIILEKWFTIFIRLVYIFSYLFLTLLFLFSHRVLSPPLRFFFFLFNFSCKNQTQLN